MLPSYWTFKVLTVCTIAAAINYIHYQDFHGKELTASLVLLFPYVVCLVLPQKWLGSSAAIPIGAGLVLSLPIAISFAWGFHTDPKQDFNLLMVLVLILALSIASTVTAILSRRLIRAAVFFTSLIGSVFYYIAAVQYAR